MSDAAMMVLDFKVWDPVLGLMPWTLGAAVHHSRWAADAGHASATGCCPALPPDGC